MKILKCTTALLLTSVLVVSANAQEEGPESTETVGLEFIGVLKQNGWADARYASIRGDGALFEIQGVEGTRRGADGSKELIGIEKLTVEGLDPGTRWIRAESIRIDGLKTVVGGNEVSIDTIYAQKPGLLDIDLGRPTAAFDNAVVTGLSWSRGGSDLLDFSEVYLSGSRWVGEFGVPGRLDVVAKGFASSAIFPFIPAAVAAGSAIGEFQLKTSLSSTRDELSIGLSYSDGATSWTGSANFTEVDNGLFRAWFDLENFDEERSEETQKAYVDAFAAEYADVALRSFEVSIKGDGRAAGGALEAFAAGVSGLAPAPFAAASVAFEQFAKDPRSFSLSGYARDGVPLLSLVSTGGVEFEKFSIRVKNN